MNYAPLRPARKTYYLKIIKMRNGPLSTTDNGVTTMATLNYVGDGKEAKTLEVPDKAARQIEYAINNSKQMVTFALTKKTEMTLAVNAITSVG